MLTPNRDPGTESAGPSFQPLRLGTIPRAALTLVLATSWSVVNRGNPADRPRRRRLAAVGTGLYVVVFVAAAWWGNRTWLAIEVAAGLVVAIAATFYLWEGTLLATTAISSTRRGWVNQHGSLVCTARFTAPRVLFLANLAGWPMGQRRSSAFLRSLCALADEEGWTLTGRAGHKHLVDALYAPLGFTILDPREAKPRIRREPQ